MRILKESVTGLSVEKGWKFKCAKLPRSNKIFCMESFAQSQWSEQPFGVESI